MPKEFENEGYILKTHQMLSIQAALEEFKDATTTGHFKIVVEENSNRKITWLS